MATTSQARSLLSIGRLNMARSRARPSIFSFVRIVQTCLGRSGGFAPVSFPLFHGTRFGARLPFTWSCMAISSAPVTGGEKHVPLDQALESGGRLSGQSGLRSRPGGKQPLANDPQQTP